MPIGEIFSGIGSLISAGTGIYNAVSQNKFNKEQFEYSKDLQQQIFDREDSAVQRRSADLQKAGFSKWLAASGSGANSGSVVSAHGGMQAPKVDLSQAILGVQSLSQMLYQRNKMIADTNLANANSAKTNAETLTEINRAQQVLEQTDLTKKQREQIEQQIEEARDSIDWHWHNLNRPRDFKTNSWIGGVANDGGEALNRIFNGFVDPIKNLFKGGKK